MNYYNPYFYSMPNSMVNTGNVGLFSRLLGGRSITLGGILNGTQRALSFANQAIPLVKQIRPMVGNAKTMFKVMNEFKRTENPKQNVRVNNVQNNLNNNVNNNENLKETIQNNTYISNDEGPTFFI